ncbi:MAG: ABC transporter permease [Chloroflexi bacterium]|nr:ABC transporter permease [Chloroflexota bacterium]
MDLIRYRELLRNLVARDLKVRYRGSILGFLWCLANPLLMMAVFTVVFTVLLQNNAIDKFPVFILIGVLAWNLHSTALMGATRSIVANAALVTKVYFPREILPISVVLSNTVNFILALVVLFAMILLFQVNLSATVLLLPLLLLSQVVFTVGLALVLATVNVFFRDTEIIMETLMLAWFFLTPIFYRIEDLFPAYARAMYILNPMASFISSYRTILYSGGMPDLYFVSRTFLTSLAFLIVGYLVFTRYSKHFGEAL